MHQLPLVFEEGQEKHEDPHDKSFFETKNSLDASTRSSAVVLSFRPRHTEVEAREREASIDKMMESVRLFM